MCNVVVVVIINNVFVCVFVCMCMCVVETFQLPFTVGSGLVDALKQRMANDKSNNNNIKNCTLHGIDFSEARHLTCVTYMYIFRTIENEIDWHAPRKTFSLNKHTG